jgi:hypothetical protein
VAEAEEVVDKGEEVVLLQARAVIAFAPTVVKEQPINWGAPVISRNAPSAERPWHGSRTGFPFGPFKSEK